MTELSDKKAIRRVINGRMKGIADIARAGITKGHTFATHRKSEYRLIEDCLTYAQLKVAKRMRLYTILLLVASILLLAAALPPALQAFGLWPETAAETREITAADFKVQRVIDGEEASVRLSAMDTPERDEPGDKEGTAALTTTDVALLGVAGMALGSLITGGLAYKAGKNVVFLEHKQEAYERILPPIIKVAYDVSNLQCGDARDFNRALPLLWLYAGNKAAKTMDIALGVLHNQDKHPPCELTRTMQEAVLAMREDMRCGRFGQPSLRPEDVGHIFTHLGFHAPDMGQPKAGGGNERQVT